MKAIHRRCLLVRGLRIPLFGLLSSLLALDFLAADWPPFRGPQGLGVSETTGVPIKFGPPENVVVKVPLPPGHSSPVFIGGTLLLTAAEDRKLSTLWLDRDTGRVLWRREAPRNRTEKYVEGFNTPASPTPVTDGERVYAFFGD